MKFCKYSINNLKCIENQYFGRCTAHNGKYNTINFVCAVDEVRAKGVGQEDVHEADEGHFLWALRSWGGSSSDPAHSGKTPIVWSEVNFGLQRRGRPD